MRIVYQLIENYLSQKVPSILISIEESGGTFKYIINVPPIYQRFVQNHKIKFQRGARYLFTKTSTETIAGLTGMMLTMFENGFAFDSKLYVDDKMYQYLEAMRYKMGFKLMPYAYCSWSGKYRLGIQDKELIFKIFEDKNQYFKIFANLQQYIQKNLKPQQINNPLKYYDEGTKAFKDEQIRIIPFSIFANNQTITNFICVPNKLVGKVNAKKLKELGLHPKQIGQLMKSGKITLDNGNILTSQQVKQPDQPSPNFIILHFNSLQSIKQIMNNPIFNQYMNNKQNFTQSVLYIIEQKQIVLSEDLKILVNRFDKKVEHAMYNRDFKNKSDKLEDVFSTSPHMDVVSEISTEFPHIMPNLNEIQSQYLKKHSKQILDVQNIFPENKFHCYKRCFQMIIAPTRSVAYKSITKQKSASKQLDKVPQQTKLKIKNIMQTHVGKQFYPQGIDFKELDPNVVFLGTGSMMPSKHRNVSAIFVQYMKNHSMMFDCGQGSYYQLFNHYGPQKIDEVILSTRIIFITHIHSDHNLGILDLISQRNRLLRKYNRNDKLYLIIPFNVYPWFNSYVEKVENLYEGCDVVFLQWIKKENLSLSEATMSKDQRKFSCTSAKSQMVNQKDQKIQTQQMDQDDGVNMGQYLSELQKKLVAQSSKMELETMQKFNNYLQQIGVVQFNPVPVVHCPQSHGIVVTHKTGIKISYSGDTIPVDKFAQASKNSTLMIHQATFGDDLAQNAKQNMHTTVGQAIDIGMKSKSWKTALTHFSQRYKSAKDIVEPALYKMNELKYNYALNHTIVCFDHMQMKLSQTPTLPFISRAIAAMIPNQKTDQ